MKATRFTMLLVVTLLSAVAFAQSDAQKSFDTLKSLAGHWEGRLTTVPASPEVDGKTINVTLRVTSTGNALLHEMSMSGRPDDPITMFYLDSDRLMLTHYCDAGNRPRMVGKLLPNGKTLEFEYLDVVGNMQYGHMHHAAFNLVDTNHHTEDWSFMVGDKMTRAHFDLQRVK